MKKLDKLSHQLHQGEISRREFLHRASALGLAASVPASLLSTSALASTPSRVGTCVLPPCRVHPPINLTQLN